MTTEAVVKPMSAFTLDELENHIETHASEIRRAYYHVVRDYAKTFVEEMLTENEIAYEDAAENAHEYIDEYLDGTSWAIYTSKHYIIEFATQNNDAYEDEMGEPAKDQMTRAIWSFRQDILEDLPNAIEELQEAEPAT